MTDITLVDLTTIAWKISDVATEAHAAVQSLTNGQNYFVDVCNGYVDDADVLLLEAKESLDNDPESIEGIKNSLEKHLILAMEARTKAIVMATEPKSEPIHGNLPQKAVIAEGPFHGNVIFDNGKYEYTPNNGYTGTDIIKYSIDGDEHIETIKVNI